jgi:hypothetical protein
MSVPHFIPFVELPRKRIIRRQMPPAVREFYTTHEGRLPFQGKQFVEFIVCIAPLSHFAAGSGRDSEFLSTWLADRPRNAWLRTKIVRLGEDCFGDEILFLPSSPARRAGGVYLVGRDVAGPTDHPKQPSTVLCIAPTIAEWLENLRKYEWIEYGVLPGEINRLSVSERKRLRAYYNTLNPGLKW